MASFQPIIDSAISSSAAIVSAVLGACALLLARLVPRYFTKLEELIEGNKSIRIRQALMNAAESAVTNFEGGMLIEEAILGMMQYAKRSVPKALADLEVDDSRLFEMCSANFSRVATARKIAAQGTSGS